MDNNKKQIVFFCATAPYVMIYKMAREFKKNGYETVLITICQKDKINDYGLYEQAFDKMICSNFQINKPNLKNLLNMFGRLPYLFKSIVEIKKLNPYIVFNISRPNYISALFMKYFNKWPQIYFPADISSQLHPDMKTALKAGKRLYEIKAERYCFEHADGVLHKGAPEEIDYLTKNNMLGSPLKMTKNIICFNPYCSDEFIAPLNKNKLSKKDGELHFVYVGSMYNGKEDIEFYNRLFEKLIDQRIHVHLYTKTHHLSIEEDKKVMGPIENKFNKSKYFHLYFAFPPKELVPEISIYDYGIWMDILRDKSGGDKEHIYTIGNKFSTYLEAGIPSVYTSTLKFIDKLMKNYGLSFPINTEDIDSLDSLNTKLKRLDYKKLEKNVIKARKDFNMKNHFTRLERFVDKVVKDKYSPNSDNPSKMQ